MYTKSAHPIGALLTTVFTSIFEVFLLCLAGYILAGKGILDKKTQKQLNRLNVSLFTPSLLFSKVAFFLSPAKLKELWIIPLFFVIITTVSMTVAFLLGWVFGVKKSQRNFAMAAAMFQNCNSLPVALMQSLVVTVPGLKWGEDDNNDAMVGRALTYLVLYSTLGMMLRWSFGVKLLSQADPSPPPIASEEDDDGDDESSPLLSSYDNQFASEDTLHPPHLTLTDSENNNNNKPNLRPPVQRQRSKFYNSFPNSPNQSRVNLPPIHSEASLATALSTAAPVSSSSSSFSHSHTDIESDNEENPRTTLPTHGQRRTAPPSSSSSATFRRLGRRIKRTWLAFSEFMTVPLWAAIASLVVACIRPLQQALNEDVRPLKGALASAGNCSIPLTLVVLGAYFYPPPQEEGEHGEERLRSKKSSASLVDNVKRMFHLGGSNRGQDHGNGHTRQREEEKRPGETKTVVIAVASRMIITPLLLLPLMAVSTMFDLQSVFDDPVFVVSNVLLIASPPALTLAQITQAASGDAFERLISRTIFWAYCVVTPPATIAVVVLGLVLSKL